MQAMFLDPEIFSDVVETLESATRRNGGGMRREPRIALNTRLTIIPCPEGLEAGIGAPLSVPVRDLSRGGLRFLLPRRIPLDTQFIVLLPAPGALVAAGPATREIGGVFPGAFEASPTARSARPASTPTMAILTAVAYWQPIGKDVFAIGGQFFRTLDDVPPLESAPRIVLPDAAATTE